MGCKVYYDPCYICLHYGNQKVDRSWSSYEFIGNRSSDAERPTGSLQEWNNEYRFHVAEHYIWPMKLVENIAVGMLEHACWRWVL